MMWAYCVRLSSVGVLAFATALPPSLLVGLDRLEDPTQADQHKEVSFREGLLSVSSGSELVSATTSSKHARS